MTHPHPACLAVVFGLAMLMAPAHALAQANGSPEQQPPDTHIYHALTTEQIESLLSSLRIGYKKSEHPKVAGIHYYDFKRGPYNMRLTDYNGKDLMLDNQANRGVPLEQVNEWNRKAKFSRASLHQDKVGPFLVLEHNLDVTGGITRGAIRQFIAQFEQECAGFERFIAAQAAPSTGTTAAERIHRPVTDEVVETVLRKLNVPFRKNTEPGGIDTFDFKMDGFALRLHNYGGNDLMINAAFRPVGLDAVNKYNIDRKFIRAVNYTVGNERTVLEANLDCAAGATEEMIRYFITVFVPEVRHFADYIAEQKK